MSFVIWFLRVRCARCMASKSCLLPAHASVPLLPPLLPLLLPITSAETTTRQLIALSALFVYVVAHTRTQPAFEAHTHRHTVMLAACNVMLQVACAPAACCASSTFNNSINLFCFKSQAILASCLLQLHVALLNKARDSLSLSLVATSCVLL